MKINILNGINIKRAIKNFTNKSPSASVTQGMPVPKNEIEKNKKVSIVEAEIDEVIGATNHFLFLNRWKISMSIYCATRKAVPEPRAILIEIKFWKFVETKVVNKTPTAKPM